MFKQKFLVILLIIGLLFPMSFCHAAWNTVTWSTQTRLYFIDVAAEQGGEKGISVDIGANSYLHNYQLDINRLKIEMYAGSEIHLKSFDRKIFTPDIGSVETVCTDEYSTWDYVSSALVETINITLADDDNCPPVEEEEEEEEESTAQVINLYELTDKVTQADLLKDDQVSFILNSLMEVMTIESIGSTKATVSLSPLNKTLYLKQDERQNVDIDADDYRDVRITLKGVDQGKASISLEPIQVVKIKNVKPGDLVKIENNSAVYYLGEDSQRYVFPHEKVYYSWYDNFDNVVTISDEDMAQLPLGGLVTYRPGVKLVTFTTTSDVYTVSQSGELRKLKDEQMATDLYGQNWTSQVDDINDAFVYSYSFGDDLETLDDYDKNAQITLNPTITIDKNI